MADPAGPGPRPGRAGAPGTTRATDDGTDDDHVAVGLVGKPFGLHGDVYVQPDVDFDVDFAPGLACRASRPDGSAPPGADTTSSTGAGGVLVVASSRIHAGRLILAFEGVEDRDAAEALRGTVLTLPRADVPLDDDAFWAGDLLGREVVDDDGALVGVVEGTLDGPAHDYLVLARPDGGEALLPAVVDLVDIGPERIVVHAIPGLLDPGAPDPGPPMGAPTDAEGR